jgi:hypothetical protein
VRYKPSVWLLTAAIAALCCASIWTVVVLRSRPLDPAVLAKRMPVQDAVLLYIDFDALRRAGILEKFGGSKVAEEPEYQAFVRETEFDYKQDLNSAMVAFAPTGKYLLLSGRFDWRSLHSYVKKQDGTCYNSFCQLAGSTEERHISFFPLKPKLMAMAVSPDNAAAIRLQAVTPGPAPEVPDAPVWLAIPASVLNARQSLPGNTGILAGALRGAGALTLAFSPEGDGAAAKLNVRCGSEKHASEIARQLSETTAALRDAMAREHQQPNAADFSGVLAAGTFRSEGARVYGRWPIGRSFLENVLGGS